MAPDDTRLKDAALAVADGADIDWERLERSVSEEDRPAVRELRLLARLAEVHRSTPVPALQPSPGAPAAPTVHTPSHPATWGPLILLERIGGGVYGDVYRARDPHLDRDVALKLLRAAPSAEGTPGQEVIEEARLLASVRHPHVVTVHGADRFEGRVGLWMELIRGRSLEREVLERGPLSAQEAAVVGIDVCAGLAAVHQAGLVHRDIKATNVMREDAGRIVLMDFGAGCVTRKLGEPGDTGLVGTPLYAAPEVFAGQPATPASDLYSLGVLLYHLVTGSFPVVETTIAGVREAHRQGERRPLRDARPDLPASVIAVVERALDPDPHNRFASAGAMEAALAGVLVGQTPVGAPPAPGETVQPGALPLEAGRRAAPRAWRTGIAVVAAAAVLLAGIFVGYKYWPRGGEAGAALGFQPHDWVLIASFDNRTGDSSLDGTVEYALQVGLENSRFLFVVPRERVNDALGLMRKPRDTRVDEAIGREVCLRDGGIRALVTGRVEKLGTTYVISTRLVEPSTGRPVFAPRAAAGSLEQIIPAVADLANRIRSGLGEQQRQLQAGGQPEKATTESFEAWELFSRGMALIAPGASSEQWSEAATLFEEATRVDPQFASAYAYLSWCLLNSGPNARLDAALAASERALQLSTDATERERLFIRGTYFDERGRTKEARNEYKELLNLYPDHIWAAHFFKTVAEPDELLPFSLRVAELRPKDAGCNSDAVDALMGVGRFDEAAVYIERVRAILEASGRAFDPSGFEIRQRWAKGDVAGVVSLVREQVAAAEKAGDEDRRWSFGFWLIGLGQLREADTFLLKRLGQIDRRGVDPAWTARGDQDMPEALLAWNAELRGDRRAARAWMQHLTARVTRRDPHFWWEIVALQARVGMTREVRRFLVDPAPLTDPDKLDWIRGELALAEGRPAEAVEAELRRDLAYADPDMLIVRQLANQAP